MAHKGCPIDAYILDHWQTLPDTLGEILDRQASDCTGTDCHSRMAPFLAPADRPTSWEV